MVNIRSSIILVPMMLSYPTLWAGSWCWDPTDTEKQDYTHTHCLSGVCVCVLLSGFIAPPDAYNNMAESVYAGSSYLLQPTLTCRWNEVTWELQWTPSDPHPPPTTSTSLCSINYSRANRRARWQPGVRAAFTDDVHADKEQDRFHFKDVFWRPRHVKVTRQTKCNHTN